MSKNKYDSSVILGSCGTPLKTECKMPKVAGVRLTGVQVLVEMLTEQEMLGTSLTVSNKPDLKVPRQGYVKSVGNLFKSTEWGFDIGDRVLISGSGVMAPNYDDCHRERFIMDPHAIKSVLIEG